MSGVLAVVVMMCCAHLRLADGRVVSTHGKQSDSRCNSTQDAQDFDAHVSSNPDMFILHISKTGGTALQAAIKGSQNKSKLQFLNHMEAKKKMASLGESSHAKVVFFVRAPVHRFTAGWLSRFRKGVPNHYAPWSEKETYAFNRFPTPDALACALGSSNATEKKDAEWVMNHLQHVSWSLVWFFDGLSAVQRANRSIAFVGRTEHFDEDYAKLVDFLDANGALESKPSPKANHTHANPEELDDYKILGRCAVKNLREWYKEDYEIIQYLAELGPLNSTYPAEVESLDEPPAEGERRQFYIQ